MNSFKSNIHLRFFTIVLYILFVYCFITILLPSFIRWFLPFIFAYAVVSITRPLAVFLRRKWRIPDRVSSIASLIIFFLTVGAMITYVITRIFVELVNISMNSSSVTSYIESKIGDFNNFIDSFRSSLSPDFALILDGTLETFFNNILSSISSLLQYIFIKFTNFAVLLPDVLIFIIVFFIACVFFAVDYNLIKTKIREFLPKKWAYKASVIKGYATVALMKYFRGMFYIFLILYFVALLGFVILKIDYAFLFAFLVALLDIMPVIGSGSFLIPYSIIMFISKDIPLGIGLVALYLCITTARQVLEPKIIGRSLGLHPLVTLASAYAGYKILGAIGIVAFPISVIIILYIFKSGVISPKNDSCNPAAT